MAIDKSACLNILNKVFIDEKYDLIDWKLESLDEVIGYHGNHGRLYIDVKVLNEVKRLRFFVKNATESKEIFDGYWKGLRCFEKEYYMFGRIIKELEDAVGEKIGPKCYMNVLNKFVVLEDLTELGYKSENDKSKELDFVWKTIEKIAVFHSASIIMENKRGKKIQDIFPEIDYENLMIKPNEKGYILYAYNRMLCNIIKHHFKDMKSHFKEPFIKWFFTTLVDLVKPSTKYRNVICHGDPWSQNFMYKCQENGEFHDIVMVDFQFSRISPPAVEIQQYLSFIFDSDKIRSMKDKVINTYYNKMNETLAKADIDITSVITRDQLNESFDEYLPFGIATNAMYTIIIAIPSDYSKKLTTPNDYVNLMTNGNIELTGDAFENDEGYRNALTKAVMDCYKYFLEVYKN